MSEMSSHFVAVCPNCLVSLRIKHAYSGSHVRCKHCEHKFRALAPDFMATPGSDEFSAVSVGPGSPEVDRISVACPMCSVSLSVRQDYAGHHVCCRTCGHKFLVENIVDAPRPAGSESAEKDLFDRLYGEPETSGSTGEPSRNVGETSELSGELEGLLAKLDQVRAELARREQELARLRSELDLALKQIEEGRGEQERLESELKSERQDLERLGDEFLALRDSFGGLTPGQVEALRNEGDSLRGQTESLREEIRRLQTELSARGELGGIVAQREEELQTARSQAQQLHGDLADARVERDQLSTKVQDIQAQLDSAHAERGPLVQQLQDLQSQLDAGRAERDELARQIERLEDDLKVLHSRNEEIASELRQRDDELSTGHVELERLAALSQESESGAVQLRAAMAQRERELGGECEALRAEIDQHRRLLDETRAAHHQDRERLDEMVRQATERFESAHSDRLALQGQVRELLETHEKTRVDHAEALELQQARIMAELQSALEDERSRHEGQLRAAEDRCQEHAQLVERLKGEVLTIAQSRSVPDGDLEAARLEIDDLRRKLAETESSKRSMSSLLEGMGIRLH